MCVVLSRMEYKGIKFYSFESSCDFLSKLTDEDIVENCQFMGGNFEDTLRWHRKIFKGDKFIGACEREDIKNAFR